MKRKSSFFYVGGFQPLFFAIGMYLMALVFSIFICAAIFNALANRNHPQGPPRESAPQSDKSAPSSPVSFNKAGH